MNNLWAWPEPERRRQRRRIGHVLFPAAFLLFLVRAVIDGYSGPYPGWVGLTVVVVVVLYSVTYMAALLYGLCSSALVRVLYVALATLFPVALGVLLNAGDLTYLTFAIVVALILLPPGFGLAYGLGGTTAMLVATAAETGRPDFDAGVIMLVLTISIFTARGFFRKSDELELARDEIRTLAVAEERARVARDLHDVLGHSLTTITLKAGLARRIMERSPDVERALAEVHDVERLSRQALTEIRATVSGYRKMSLPAEIANAKAALLAAGIDADLPQAVDDVPGELREPFGYVLREAVTNVIRHSGASRCEIRLGESWIEVVDNGRGVSTGGDQDGNGLAGLRERLAKVDGRLKAAERGEKGGFVVRADVTT
ncbi:sensor histidine kinase [Kibdelosporangium phytohabitans]|uniref:sensor histidine kinase n=1 Tax=Kibdelosporangium phytohabitans TaxID=860235 RepID=UPI001A06E199|nr:histidine kinase [Kibdelosporangium phytohabitans]MBE1471496.1 two-component system sensor histidine kinase DesK [Kibdelosporangium phytohabitans]